MTYFDGARSMVGVADYDINLNTLNILSLVGNWSFDSGLALSASADYRRSPFPLTENALIGQPAGSIDELLNSLTEDQIQRARRRPLRKDADLLPRRFQAACGAVGGQRGFLDNPD